MPNFKRFTDLSRKRWFILITISILTLLLLKWLFINFFQKPTETAQTVVPAIAKTMDVPVTLLALGTVVPLYTITVKTQVNGQLTRVLFKEGQMVKRGDLLAEIDPRPFLAQLAQYQGQLNRDTAQLANAKLDLKRYKKLWAEDSVSKQVYDTQAALVKQYEGAVDADKGLIEATRVSLIYCRITSPIDGRIGLRLVDAGNFVQTSDTTGLAVITTLNPITIIFTLPEDDVPKVVQQLELGKTLTVEAYNRDQSILLGKGLFLSMDNQIDPTTGTFKLKAIFANQHNVFFPNQFVNVKLVLETLKQATVIPTAAIQYGIEGAFVYVLNQDKTKVNTQAVKVGVATAENSVIKSGLSPGQVVVVEGADKLTDGISVTLAEVPTKKSVST